MHASEYSASEQPDVVTAALIERIHMLVERDTAELLATTPETGLAEECDSLLDIMGYNDKNCRRR